jgi:polyisoprenoid-binding protein YceI
VRKPRELVSCMRCALLCFVIVVVPSLLAQAQTVPVFTITPVQSTITYYVKASVKITGTFDKWDASLTFTSPDVTTGVVDVKIQAASVHSGSKKQDEMLKSKDGFDPEHNPLITFHSTKIVQTGPETFDVPGTFTLRGISKPQTLKLTATGHGTGDGTVTGTMAFDRRDYGFNKGTGIPFVKIADRVEVTVELRGKRVSGPPLVLQK